MQGRGQEPTTYKEIPVRVGYAHQVHALHQCVEPIPLERGWRRYSLDRDKRVEALDTSPSRIHAL
jgi:hypothetical protein